MTQKTTLKRSRAGPRRAAPLVKTWKLADDLEAAKGDPRQTARVIGETIGTIDVSDLATKADIADVKGDIGALDTKIASVATTLDAKIDTVAATLKAEIAQSTNRAIYTLGGLVGVLFIVDRVIALFGVGN
ncbi:hypothetical protein [Ruegeria atlantica]|uniref:hypothetical protein n=1 Tax=Ruegeria atlantica TaxID=81569 RepID=UPI00147DD0B1|nr:hypothetical protein [Ruegeria atlantica]